jgi:hypothetical protein
MPGPNEPTMSTRREVEHRHHPGSPPSGRRHGRVSIAVGEVAESPSTSSLAAMTEASTRRNEIDLGTEGLGAIYRLVTVWEL